MDKAYRVVRDADDGSRLALALLLALGLHAGLLFGVSVDSEMVRSFQPPRFEITLLFPTERPTASEPRTAETEPGEARNRGETVQESTPPPESAPSPPPVAAATPPTVKPVSPGPPATVEPPPKPATVKPPAKPPTAAPKPPPPPPAPAKPVRSPPAAAKPTSAAAPRPAKPAEPAQQVAKPTPPRPERPTPAGTSPETRAPSRLDSSALLGQVASLETETQRRASAGVRSKRVSPSDTQSLEGFYIAAWVRKVEQIGEMNFPEIARRLSLNTGPVLDVSIRADGSLKEVRVVRSSGYPELDQAAQRIVKLGAPYAPFPPSLRQKYDVLQIARPWRFDPGGRVRPR